MPDDAAIEALTANDTESFTLSVSDGATGTDTATFTVNLTGVNDTPVLSASLTSTTYTDTAGDDTFTPVTGTLTSTDRDAGQTPSYDISGSVADASLADISAGRAMVSVPPPESTWSWPGPWHDSQPRSASQPCAVACGEVAKAAAVSS